MPVSPQYYCGTLTGRNKRSVALDLNDAAARAALLKMVMTADVFITNYQPPLVAKFGLGYSELAALNDRLVYAYLTGYGEAGDECEKPSYDITAYWTRAHLMNTMHNADAQPTQSPARFRYHPPSHPLFVGITY